MEAFTQSAGQPAPSSASESTERQTLHVSIATPHGPESDIEDFPATALDADCNPTLEDTLMDDTVTPPAELSDAPRAHASTPEPPPQSNSGAGIAPDDDEAIPQQTVLPAALPLDHSWCLQIPSQSQAAPDRPRQENTACRFAGMATSTRIGHHR
eukprot:978712-Amphidinium_carterae.2